MIFSLLFIFIYIFSGCSSGTISGPVTGVSRPSSDSRSIGAFVDDSMILTSIKTKMLSDDFIESRQIHIDVINGVVYLTGTVESLSQKRMAADIARSVDGVKRVENQLGIGKSPAGFQ